MLLCHPRAQTREAKACAFASSLPLRFPQKTFKYDDVIIIKYKVSRSLWKYGGYYCRTSSFTSAKVDQESYAPYCLKARDPKAGCLREENCVHTHSFGTKNSLFFGKYKSLWCILFHLKVGSKSWPGHHSLPWFLNNERLMYDSVWNWHVVIHYA